MKKTLVLLIVVSTLFSCKQNTRFSVSGTVKDAEGSMLYMEHAGLLKTTVLDSIKLDADGSFSFSGKRPEYPDFYRLRLEGKQITFAVDSCEEISFETQNKNFSTEYTVAGSNASQQILKLRKSVMNIQQKANKLPEMTAEQRQASIEQLKKEIEAHKAMARQIILADPRSMAAYFAIYQQINDSYLFSPYVKEDRPYTQAVATSFLTYMPEYIRSKNLSSLVLDAMRTDRDMKSKQAWDQVLDKVGKGYIDIALKDRKNVTRKLSDLEGKVVLIDFSAYEVKESVDYTFALRDLYNKYHKRGFEIYQVSLDQNKLIWEESSASIPWVCVRDEKGPETRYASSYNVSSIPTSFLLDRKGNIITRTPSFRELDELIKNNL